MHVANIKKSFNILLATLIVFSYLLTSGVAIFKPQRAIAATYTVTNNNDSGAGSLRQAILDANSNPGADIIVFDNAYTIQPTSALPNITDEVEINGYTGSPGGATANSAASPAPFNGTLTVELDGTSAGASNGLNFDTGSEGSSVRGLVINNFEQSGIAIGVDDITIAGNFIGVDTAGTTAIPNNDNGIYISDGSNATIGGSSAADRNVISGNADNGIFFDSAAATHTIAGNIIGLSSLGSAALPNGSNGIAIQQTNQVTVGGSSSAAKNIISGNTGNGVWMSGATGTVVAGNYIGTNYDGTVDLGNGVEGVNLSGSDGNTIGGLTSDERNILSGNDSGVNINNSDSNTVLGNYIGTNASGSAAIANLFSGISLAGGSANNTIGGTTEGARNVISGNTDNGVTTDGSGGPAGTGNAVLGNYIGLGADGVTAIANDYGLGLFDVDGFTVGGTTEGARNVISGNTTGGINLTIVSAASVNNNTILGNYIGSDYTGTVGVGNGGGIQVRPGTGTGNVVGGTAAGAGNTIVDNGYSGIEMDDAVLVQGNWVGIAADGSPMGNGTASPNYPNVTITGNGGIFGGTSISARNFVADGQGPGIAVSGNTPLGGSQTSNATVQGNCIGTNLSCEVEAGYGNEGSGITNFADTTDILIGGTTAGAGNVVAGNGAGILNIGFQTYTPVFSSVLGNSVHDNSGFPVTSLGIDNLQTNDFVNFINAGVTLNDADDIDYAGNNTGTNHYLNFPVINSITSTNGQVTINYDLDINDAEAGATGYRVEFFANDAADPSGYGEGQTFLGYENVAGDVTGQSVTLTLPSGVEGNKFISATTIMTDESSDGFGHTSEFGALVEGNLVPTGSVTPTSSDNTVGLASTGRNIKWIGIIAAVLLAIGGAGLFIARRKQKFLQK